MSSTTHVSRSDAASERELGALAAIYRRAIQRYTEAKAAAGPGGEDDAKGTTDDRAETSVSR